MTKNIVAIVGSPRNKESFTYQTIARIEERLQSIEDVNVDYIFLQELDLPFCDGCLSCVNVGESSCPDYTKVESVIKKMEASDGLILGAPVHTFNVAGLMKNFCEYLMYKYSRPSFFGKKAIVVTCAAGGGHDVVLDFLERQCSSWGFDVVSRLGVSRTQFGKEFYEELLNSDIHDMAITLIESINKDDIQSPTLKQLINFKVMQTMTANAVDTVNHQYWLARGWLDNQYYIDKGLSMPKNIIANIVVGKIRKAIKKGKVKPVR